MEKNILKILISALVLHLTVLSHLKGDEKKWVEGLPPIQKGSATLAILPDTEYYSWKYHDMFYAQTGWIASQAEKRNIKYTIHLGDITQHNNHEQWTVTRKSFAKLDGKVPYALVPGNDDYDDLVDGNWEKLRSSSLINKYFNPEEISKWPTFGGFYKKNRLENTYHLFTMQNQKWLILCLEMGARDEILKWADKVLKEKQDHKVIVVTHAYLFRNNQRYNHHNGHERASPHPWGNDGEELWQKLIKKHGNIMIVMSGHVSTGGIGYRKDTGDKGNVVHQMMCDYQKKPKGGLAYMRLLEFMEDGKTVRVQTYSPYTKKRQISALEDFSFTLKEMINE